MESLLSWLVPFLTGRQLYCLSDSQDYKTYADKDDLQTAEEYFCKECPPFGCQEEFSDLMILLMEDNNLSMPNNADEAEQLFLTLFTELQSIL